MRPPNPKEPPVAAYPLLTPEQQRKVDAVPPGERAVFAWLLLIAHEKGWRERKDACLVCEKSGWPCLDPASPGSRTRCEGCYCAGYHCQTIVRHPATPATSTSTSGSRSAGSPGTQVNGKTTVVSGAQKRVSEAPLTKGDRPQFKAGHQAKRKSSKIQSYIVSDDSESDASESGASVSAAVNAQRSARGQGKPSKKRRLNQERKRHDDSSHVGLNNKTKHHAANATPSVHQVANSTPPVPPLSRHSSDCCADVNSHNSVAEAPVPARTPAQSFLELLEGDSDTGGDSSDSSSCGPLPPRPAPIPNIPALSAPRAVKSSPMSPPLPSRFRHATSPAPDSGAVRTVTDRRPNWESPDDQESSDESMLGEADAELEEDDEGEDTGSEGTRYQPVHSPQSPRLATRQPPYQLSNNTRFTPEVVRRVLAAVQDTGANRYGISFDGEPIRPASEIVLVLPKTRLPGKNGLPWRIGIYNPTTKAGFILHHPKPGWSHVGVKQRDRIRKNMTDSFANSGLVPEVINPSAWVLKDCPPEHASVDGGTWACVLCLGLTRDTVQRFRDQTLGRLLIRKEFVVGDFNAMLRGANAGSSFILFTSGAHRRKINETAAQVAAMTEQEIELYTKTRRNRSSLKKRSERKRLKRKRLKLKRERQNRRKQAAQKRAVFESQ